jgi:H+/Cl- antiporter ClcA
MTDPVAIDRVLSPRIAVGKILLTLLGLLCGASIGREGPTVQVGASAMHLLGRALKLPRMELQRSLVLAGGAAGVAAAFNTPLAGIVFAIEELSHSFEARTSGTVLTAVILAGITTLALAGNYTYFGTSQAELDFGAGWLAVALCALAGGVAGGAFSAALVGAAKGLPGAVGRLVGRYPVAFAALCGLAVAGLGIASAGTTYGTGYAQAREVVEGSAHMSPWFPVLKLLATVASYLSGIPGGIFAPSLAIGAGIGQWVSGLIPSAPSGAVVLLGMVGYFSAVVQAPITATVIVMEMTDNQRMKIPLLATALLAFGISRLVCRRPLYGALARRFLVVMSRKA